MTHKLSRLLKPKTIAVFGGAWAENVIEQLQKTGFEGDIWPVHPKRETVNGLTCFKNVDELPSAPDASFIGVNRELTIDIISQLSSRGAGGATCFASGFLESEAENQGGADLQSQLISAAGDMPILGPNCYGLLNYVDKVTLWPDQHGGRKTDHGVAIIGQSSNVLINLTMQKRGLPISYVIAAGNQAQTGLADITDFMIYDPAVSAIGLYIEGFGDIRKLEHVAKKARDANKPIIAIKTGKSVISKLATMTHTASLAGNAEASSALMKRLGIIEVDSIAVFLETLKLLHVCGPLTGNNISSMSCSGGEAGLIADMVTDTEINFRGLSETQYRKLKSVLGPLVTVSNPLDYHTFIWSDEEKLYQCYKSVLEDGFDLNILIMDIPHDGRCNAKAWEGPIRAAKRAKQDTNANLGLLATLPENLSEAMSDDLIQAGIVPLHGMEEMISAINALAKAAQSNIQNSKPVMLADQETKTPVTLDEAKSKNELAEFGVKFPTNRIAETFDALDANSKGLSFPVVLKGLGIAHKSEAGAVALNLDTFDDVVIAAKEMSGVSRYLVEEMVPPPIAELLIGITGDETGLYLLTIGAGGTLTELLSDSASLLIPSTREEISLALDRLKISKILHGYRGAKPADMDAILDTIENIQNYCMNTPELIELDINPLMAFESNAIAVDALIIKDERS